MRRPLPLLAFLLAIAPSIASAQVAFSPSFVGGAYRSDPSLNALTDGAQRLAEIGANAVNIYLDPAEYDDTGAVESQTWAAYPVARTLKERAMHPLFYKVIADPRFTIVSLTLYPVGGDPSLTRDEMYDLTVWLRRTFQGSGKTFILKNWEGDYHLMGTDQSVFTMTRSADFNACVKWINIFRQRQRMVAQGRTDTPSSDVQVLHAVEVAKVMQAMPGTVVRLANLLPYIAPDMVAYSSYDAMNDAGDSYASVKANLAAAIAFLRDPVAQLKAVDAVGYRTRFAASGLKPDTAWSVPQRRIAITEFGVDQQRAPTGRDAPRSDEEVRWRVQATVDAARDANVFAAFWWNLYDNECYPCSGYWLLRPDGSRSVALDTLMQSVWQCQLAPAALRVTSARQPAPDVLYWGDADNTLRWRGDAGVLAYRTLLSPGGATDDGAASSHALDPRAAVGAYRWSVDAHGRMCDASSDGGRFTIVPPPPAGVSVAAGGANPRMWWQAISGPPGMTYELSINGETIDLGTATEYPLRRLPPGDYSYILRTKANGVYTTPAAEGRFTISTRAGLPRARAARTP